MLDPGQGGHQFPMVAVMVRPHRLQDQGVCGGEHQVRVGGQQHWSGAVVRCDRTIEGLGQRRHLAALAEAAGPGDVDVRDVDGAAAERLAVLRPRARVLAAGDPPVHPVLVAGEVGEAVHGGRIFVPADLEGGERSRDLQRRQQLPQAMVLNHDLDPVAGALADRLDALHAPLQMRALLAMA